MKILFLIPSLAHGGQEKAGMILTNYLGRFHDVKVVSLESANEHDYPYKVGDRIAQIMIVPYPKVIFEEVNSKDDLGETERGDGGHGSTGK